MPRTEFAALPSEARLWIFTADRALSPAERDRLLAEVDAYLDGWQAHGRPLTSARDWRHDRFLLVAVDESAAGASGCSIDKLIRSLEALESALGVRVLDHGPVVYRDDQGIQRVARPTFADLARRGIVGPETIVFNNTLTRAGDLAEKWEVPARDSWHGRAFFASATPA